MAPPVFLAQSRELSLWNTRTQPSREPVTISGPLPLRLPTAGPEKGCEKPLVGSGLEPRGTVQAAPGAAARAVDGISAGAASAATTGSAVSRRVRRRESMR